jgi:hypothetical protein
MRARVFLGFVAAWLAALLAVMTVASEAYAQACPTPKAKPSDADIEQAKKSMAAGVAFMQDPEGARYEEAYPQFRQAYQLSGSLNALQNLAICATKLELDGEAIECFKRFLDKKGSDISPDDKVQVENDLRALESAVAWVTFSSDMPNVTLQDVRTPRRGAVVRNGYTIGTNAIKLGVHPGEHAFTATVSGAMSGFPAQEWKVEIKAGEKLNKDFVFEKDKPVTADGFKPEDLKPKVDVQPKEEVKPDTKEASGSRPVPAYVWAVGGVTVAAGIGWGVSGGLALAKGSAYKKNNTPEAAAAGEDLEGQRKSVQTLNLVADVMMGVTLAGGVTTLVLFLTRPTVAAKPNEKAARSWRFGHDWTVAPSVDGHSGGAVMTANF